MSVRARRRTRRAVAAALVAIVVVLAAIASLPAGAATSGSVVGATVPGATSIANNCTGAPATSLGTLSIGASSLTDTGAGACSWDFGSSNSTATARIHQRDRVGTAMGSIDATQWQDISPPFTQYGGLEMVDATYAFRGRSNGTIERTSDGGSTWDPETSPFTGSVTAIAAIDADNAYAVGGDTSAEIAVRTTAGGSTWASRTAPVGVGVLGGVAIDPTDSDVAMAVSASGHIIRTTDGGANWSIVHTGGGWLLSISILDSTLAYAVGPNNVVLRSSDGGTTWSAANGDLPAFALALDVALTPGPVLWIGTNTGLVRSTNPAAPSPNFTNVYATITNCFIGRFDLPTPTDLLVSNNCGNVARSTNALDPTPSFTVTSLPTTGLLLELDAISSTVALAGNEGSILRTTTGTSWSVVEYTRGQARTMHHWDAERVAVGAGLGFVYTTQDGGATWLTRNVGSPTHVNAIVMSGPDEITLVAEDERVYTSDDMGATWSSVATGTAQSLAGIVRTPLGTILVAGDNGAVRRSSDGGSTWQAIDAGTSNDLRGLTVDPDTGDLWLGDLESNTLLRSTDDGRTWSTSMVPGVAGIIFVEAVGDGNLWIVDTARSVWRSDDGGATWADVTPSGVGTMSFDAIDGNHAVASEGFFGTPRVTDDGGATWTAPPPPTAFQNGIVTMVDAATAYTYVGPDQALRLTPATSVPDYAPGPADWASGASLFGFCIQSITNANPVTWLPDAGGIAGLCEASDGDDWQALPTTPTSIASTASDGDTGSFDLVFGMHAGSGLPPHDYVATIDVEVLSPAV